MFLTFQVVMFVAVPPSGRYCCTFDVSPELRVVLILVYTLWLIDKHNADLHSQRFKPSVFPRDIISPVSISFRNTIPRCRYKTKCSSCPGNIRPLTHSVDTSLFIIGAPREVGISRILLG